MKAKILVTILLISLMPIPSTTAQVPTASVSIDCLDDGLNVTSLYSINDIAEEDPRQPRLKTEHCTCFGMIRFQCLVPFSND